MFNKDKIICGNEKKILFELSPADIKRVDYTTANYFQIITIGKTYRFPYLQMPEVGENIITNMIFGIRYYGNSEKYNGTRNKFLACLSELKIDSNRKKYTELFFLSVGNTYFLKLIAVTLFVIVTIFFMYEFLI